MRNFVANGMRDLVRKILILTAVACAGGLIPLDVNYARAGVFSAGVYSIAKRYVGLHERKHTKKLAKTVGVKPRRTPWCGAFVGAVVKKAGKSVPAGHLRAASWKRVCKAIPLKKAKKGDGMNGV